VPNVGCVDNYFTSSRANIEHLLAHKRFEVIRHDVTFPPCVEVNEIYNLACPASRALPARSGADYPCERVRRDHSRQRQPDIARAKEVLGWTPTTPLKEGLARTTAYFNT
jgi:hypothetical protein